MYVVLMLNQLACFCWYIKSKNGPRNARVIIKNKLERFYGSRCSCGGLTQSPDAWAILGHHMYLTGDMQEAKSCYERATSFTADASEMHSIYLRLGSIYLQEGQVGGCTVHCLNCWG